MIIDMGKLKVGDLVFISKLTAKQKLCDGLCVGDKGIISDIDNDSSLNHYVVFSEKKNLAEWFNSDELELFNDH